jgi:hypothetical protein
LARVHSIYEELSAKSKRVKQAQQSIQKSMEAAAQVEERRLTKSIREIERVQSENEIKFPPLIPESLEILYVSGNNLNIEATEIVKHFIILIGVFSRPV